MQALYTCLGDLHDGRLLLIAAMICIVGVYASFSIAAHAGRSERRARQRWGLLSILAAGATAWATHMILLLAFQPGMLSGFDPWLTVLSLLVGLVVIGIGMGLSIGRHSATRRFGAGTILGAGIVGLHYLGQASYRVTGETHWDGWLVVASSVLGMLICGLSMVSAGARRKPLRPLSAPLLLLSIAVIHIGGMLGMQLVFDPSISLPPTALSPETVAPAVAAVSLSLIALAFVGLRFTINAKLQARRDQLRLRELASVAIEGLAVCNDGIIVSTNASLERLSGYEQDELIGRPIASLLMGQQVSSLPLGEEQDARLLHQQGQVVPVRVVRSEVKLGSKVQIVIAVRDQRERLRTEAHIRVLAYTDALTGLANRQRFNDLLEEHASACAYGVECFSLLLLDLDQFKAVNDTLGHGLGDKLLKAVAERLTAVSNSNDVVARLGGDEFAIIITGRTDAARQRADALLEAFSLPFSVDGHMLEISTSIGIASAFENGFDPTELTRKADLALYEAKREGRNKYRLFADELSLKAQARRSLELDLRHALAHDQLSVYYQPQVDSRSSTFEGAEALVRWFHPERGSIAPIDFIAIAEEAGLIGKLGEFVLREACREAARWPETTSVAVNLSPIQLRDRQLPDIVSAILHETGLPAERLELEITESALLHDDGVTYSNLHALRACGIRIALDDFGTGYSSLSYLRRFPFSKIKIDRSFVSQVPHDADSMAIVETVITLAHRLGMTVTAEGVETNAQLYFAAMKDCQQAQGYLVGKPMGATELRGQFLDEKQRQVGAVARTRQA